MRAGAIAQLEMPGDEVGVEVREEHVADRETMLSGEREVLVDVALGSTTAATRVASSPIRYDAWARHPDRTA